MRFIAGQERTKWYNVYLNGELVKDCYYADEEEG